MVAYASRLDALLKSHPAPTWRAVAWPVMVLLALSFMWANFAKLDEVASSPGEVVPMGKVKVIQHLEGGIIQDIFVAEGDIVREGQPLLQLDLGSGGANIEELQVRLDGEILARARLEAEAKGTDPIFPPDIASRIPEQANAQRQAFDARRRQMDSGLSVLKRQVTQRELEVQELQAKLTAARNNLKSAEERFKISTDLLKDGLTSRVDHLQLGAEVETLQGELKSIQAGIPRARAAVSEANSRLEEETNRFRSEAQNELSTTEQTISRIRELLNRANEQGVRSEVKSPIDGVVTNMNFTAVGNVVKPGDPIMAIVPTGEKLVIESRLRPTDRGYVAEGQKALVKISTYDFARYGGLDGLVVLVAPDSSTDENGLPYFRVVVETDKAWLGMNEGELPIMPGMEATVDIHTGQKTVMDYLVKPVLKLRHEAFRER
ncbi:MAG: HlyD family type I secretion periplasmic adaptor subunit [Rhodospirillaceae bacterium]|nr:HlyD family type I secretion periplasmic adaptor subunit [Rhodospirillaceae bacterium]